MAKTIKHQGIVENIDGLHLRVRIIQTSACAACSVKSHCTSADSAEKLIDIVTHDAASYVCGERVWVTATLAMGMKAVMLAFVAPLVLLVAVLFVSMAVCPDELLAAACTLPCLAVYYFLLWLGRKRLGREFAFSIRPVS